MTMMTKKAIRFFFYMLVLCLKINSAISFSRSNNRSTVIHVYVCVPIDLKMCQNEWVFYIWQALNGNANKWERKSRKNSFLIRHYHVHWKCVCVYIYVYAWERVKLVMKLNFWFQHCVNFSFANEPNTKNNTHTYIHRVSWAHKFS